MQRGYEGTHAAVATSFAATIDLDSTMRVRSRAKTITHA
jgi:hypothetical protein